MTEREQTLVFMANYIEDRELFDEPWRVGCSTRPA